MISWLEHVSASEGIKIDKEGLRLVARSSSGSMRDALNLLEQVTTYYGCEPSLSQVQAMLGVTGDYRAKELVKRIIKKDISSGIATINAVNNDGLDLKQFSRELVEYLRNLLLIKTGSIDAADLSAEELAEMKLLASGAPVEQILRAVKLFGALQPGFDSYPTLPLELALVDSSLAPEPPPAVEKSAQRAASQPQKAAAPAPVAHKPLPPKKEAPPAAAPVQPKAAPAPVASVPVVPKPAPAPVVSQTPKAAPRPAPVPEQEPAVAKVTTPLEAGSELERLRQNWKTIINEAPLDIRKSPALALLRTGRLLSFENDTVVLAFRYEFHKQNIEKPENQKIVDKVVSSFLGRACHVSCVLQQDNHMLKAALTMGAQIIDAEEK